MNDQAPQHDDQWWDQVDPVWKKSLDESMLKALSDTNDLTDEELGLFLFTPSIQPYHRR